MVLDMQSPECSVVRHSKIHWRFSLQLQDSSVVLSRIDDFYKWWTLLRSIVFRGEMSGDEMFHGKMSLHPQQFFFSRDLYNKKKKPRNILQLYCHKKKMFRLKVHNLTQHFWCHFFLFPFCEQKIKKKKNRSEFKLGIFFFVVIYMWDKQKQFSDNFQHKNHAIFFFFLLKIYGKTFFKHDKIVSWVIKENFLYTLKKKLLKETSNGNFKENIINVKK